DVDGGVVMECRICGGSCGGYDVGIVEVEDLQDKVGVTLMLIED
ncbi:hypothetical protein Tco_1099244, partial [Tanacetum coccineum]